MNDVPPARHADESPIVSAAPVGLESTRVERASLAINAFLSAIVALTAGIVEVACWAHARRKFYEARNSDPARSAQALAYIRLLYDVEDQAKEKHLDAAARAALRQQLALPRLSQFKAWLEAQQLSEGGGVLPKSPMGEAITYALNQYNALCVYVSDGDLAIDNNAGENALRRIGVGRNYAQRDYAECEVAADRPWPCAGRSAPRRFATLCIIRTPFFAPWGRKEGVDVGSGLSSPGGPSAHPRQSDRTGARALRGSSACP